MKRLRLTLLLQIIWLPGDCEQIGVCLVQQSISILLAFSMINVTKFDDGLYKVFFQQITFLTVPVPRNEIGYYRDI